MKLAMHPKQSFLCPLSKPSNSRMCRCCPFPEWSCLLAAPAEVVPLDNATIEPLIIESAQSDVNTALVRLLGSAFGNSEILSVSFMKSPLNTELDGIDTGLDFEEVRKFYNSLSDKKVRPDRIT